MQLKREINHKPSHAATLEAGQSLQHVPRDYRNSVSLRACEAISPVVSLRAQRGKYCQSPLWGLRACEAISLFLSLRAQRGKYCQSPLWGLRAREAISLFLSLRAQRRVMSKPPLGVASLRSNLSCCVIASLRSNLSFRCLPALNKRDRHVPRLLYCHCEPAKQSLFSCRCERSMAISLLGLPC